MIIRSTTRNWQRTVLLVVWLIGGCFAGSLTFAAGNGDQADNEPVVFIPPEVGLPGDLEGGGTRDTNGKSEFGLRLLVPPRGGLTVARQPVLYWYLQRPFDGIFQIVLSAEDHAPLLDLRGRARLSPGLRVLSLERFHVSLEAGDTYRWIVSLNENGGEYVEAASASLKAISADDTRLQDRRSIKDLAANGIWVDAFDKSVSEFREGADKAFRSLLDYIRASDVATFYD